MRQAWVAVLAEAQKRPDMFVGGREDAHLFAGIHSPLAAVWQRQAFTEPRGARIAASPQQYHCRCACGALLSQAADLIEWGKCDVLLEGLRELDRRLLAVHQEWARLLSGATHCTGCFATPLYLAQRGAVAFRTPAGLWAQPYDHGWPTAAPHLVAGAGEDVGLMVVAALSPEWFPGLPFTPETIERAVPRTARPHVTVEWHPRDDIVPECANDPRCVLRPENVGRWL